jgi:putative membrane protein
MLLVMPVTAADTKVAASDVKFAKKAAAGGMMEVKLGEIAQKQAASAEVKEFGAMMVTDHGKANQQLMEIAAKENLKVPKQLPKRMQAMVDDLSKLEGKAFDTAYVNAMVKDHKEDLAEFKKEAADSTNPALKSFAEDTAKVIEHHLQVAEGLQAKIK